MFKPVPCTGSFIVALADGIVHSVIIFDSSFITSFTVIFLVTVISVSVCATPALLYVLVIV